MERSDIDILVIEDDKTLGSAIEQALSRVGYKAILAKTPDEARQQARLRAFEYIIVDCMLPSTNGVDLADELTKKSEDEIKVILMSGIFKDKQFIRQAQKRVNCLAFLTKPFELPGLIDLIDEDSNIISEDQKNHINNLFFRPQISNKDRVNAIDSQGEIHGYELPWIYNLLTRSTLNGELHLSSSSGAIGTISFSNGNICQVVIDDKESYFGVLCVENGFTHTDDVEKELVSESKKRIGERLVDASALSPHAIQVINQQQMAIRLSKTIRNESMSIKFIEQQVSNADTTLTHSELVHHSNDWVSAKLSDDWVRSQFNVWLEHSLLPGPNYERRNEYAFLSLFVPYKGALETIENSPGLQELFSQNQRIETAFMKMVYFLLIQNVYIFDSVVQNKAGQKSKVNRLVKILESFHNKNHFEVMGVGKNASEKEINRAYHDYAKALHPDKLPPSAPAEVKELTKKVFAQITESYSAIKTTEKRNEYLQQLQLEKAQLYLKEESLFDQAIKDIRSRRYQEALAKMLEIEYLREEQPDFYIYMVWAQIKTSSSRLRKTELQEVYSSLNLVPPEQRHNAPYFYVKGLLYLQINGKQQKAYNCFKNAAAIDPGFIEAKMELAKIPPPKQTHTSIFNMDLTNIFKKKKSG